MENLHVWPLTHSPLHAPPEQKDLRLLRIEPAATEDDQVSCRMEHHSTRENDWSDEWKHFVSSLGHPVQPRDRLHWRKTKSSVARYKWGDYYSLSYTWGDTKHLTTILVNGHDFQVTRNLQAALRDLRNSGALPEGCLLWADSLCINQSDKLEKGREVGRMKTIYSRSLETIVYLGYGDPGIEAAVDFINSAEGCWDDVKRLKATISKHLQTASPDLWQNIVAFADLPYWWRQWVMQEMAAGSGEKPMHYGKSHTTSRLIWDMFRHLNRRHRNQLPLSAALWDVIESYPQHYERLLESGLPDHRGPTGIRAFVFSDDGEGEASRWNTYQILSTARKNQATDARDYVYGLLGLLSPGLAAAVTIDYEADPNIVFETFTKTVISTEQRLEILGQCDMYGSPSWVPRLNVNFPWYRHPHHELEAPFKADAGHEKASHVHFETVGDQSVLRTTALLFDVLDGLSSANLETDYNNENRLYKGGYAEELVHTSATNVANAYGSKEALREAIWRTAGGDRDVVGAIPGPRTYEILLSTEMLEERYRFNPLTAAATSNTGAETEDDSTTTEAGDPSQLNPWAGWARKNSEFRIAGTPLLEYFAPAGLQDRSEDERRQAVREGRDAAKRFTNACWSRRMVVTQRGYVGYVPWYAEKGDYVALLPGCSFPVLLRTIEAADGRDGGKGEKWFKFVAPCYVHGIMNGEGWAGVDAGEKQTEQITLV
ncbi:heterokaryon incompatibility protein-domain-containing protein [Cadophora sp. MPI-SDFR-AT-0126]|nr:heterokaryon incompatibility protein-domain-containing protein [Leotiomycetes sp. MPI-SDFR-AT-0126]